jgi:RNA polymerase sigma factor (sigma-70 family)
MSNVCRGAVVDSIQRLFERGTLISLGERQLLDRFLTCADESAFEAIVGRHGPMVLSVCRRVLADEQDVEDAFQATFLILVKRAGSIRDRHVLGTWLHGVARRVAVRAQANARRRRSHERSGVEQIDVPDHRNDLLESNEIRAIVDAELERLPQRFRAPLILCDLEGRTHEQAAVELRCPVGTIKSRLSRGRERLRGRLAQRGLAALGLPPMRMLAGDPSSTVSFKLLNQTIRSAIGLATKGTIASGSIMGHTALFSERLVHIMAMTKLKLAIVACIVAGSIGGGVWTAVRRIPALKSHGTGRAGATLDSPQSAKPGAEKRRADEGKPVDSAPVREDQKADVPKRGALRIGRLKHAGDWNTAAQAIPIVMDVLRKPPLNFDVVIKQKELLPRDPNLVYYPLIYIHGRTLPPFDKADLETLRQQIDPGNGTFFADAHGGAAAFDADFRRFVKELLPAHPLIPIPQEDDLYTAKVGFDLSKVEYNKAAGERRGYPELEGVRINNHWAIIYSKHDIGGVLDGNANIKGKGYTADSAKKILSNIVIHSTLP